MNLYVDTFGHDLPGLIHASFDGPVAVIGDIHGRANLLDALLEQLPEDVQLVVVGDLCDRGPDTKQVIECLVERNAIGVRGNHDLWLIQWAQGKGFDRAALAMGGHSTLDSYRSVGKDQQEIDAEGPSLVPEHHRKWLETLGLALDLRVAGQRYWVVHAGVTGNYHYDDIEPEDVVPWLVSNDPAALLWTNVRPHEALALADAPVIMGHRPIDEPLDSGHVLAIDTRAGFGGGRLTAVLLPERRFVTVG